MVCAESATAPDDKKEAGIGTDEQRQ